VLGAYDLGADYLRTTMRPRRSGAETPAFMRGIGLWYRRALRIFWVQDNLSAN